VRRQPPPTSAFFARSGFAAGIFFFFLLDSLIERRAAVDIYFFPFDFGSGRGESNSKQQGPLKLSAISITVNAFLQRHRIGGRINGA